MEKKLEVGDTLYGQNHLGHTNRKLQIVRVTSKYAYSDAGHIIERESSFWEYKQRALSVYFKLETEQLKKSYEEYLERREIDRWWAEKDFTFEEQRMIYQLFNPSPKNE
jgi:hypothetical protein